eukprot:TRINITY_DN7319_c0_g2_i3.p1 TRINITY_DN7319_c0_g2~~TRINITY_DN7319_c0_g2_i3.p1  ORF type:complete len:150 (+),score=20.07 TRINITY_DN7319_c0_g2_i3:416-865(+)
MTIDDLIHSKDDMLKEKLQGFLKNQSSYINLSENFSIPVFEFLQKLVPVSVSRVVSTKDSEVLGPFATSVKYSEVIGSNLLSDKKSRRDLSIQIQEVTSDYEEEKEMMDEDEEFDVCDEGVTVHQVKETVRVTPGKQENSVFVRFGIKD